MKRKKYNARFKFDRVIDSIETGSVAQVARQFSVNPNLISNWRKDFFAKGPEAFERKPDQEVKSLQRKIVRLEQMIGKKEVELGFLKNFSDFYASRDGS